MSNSPDKKTTRHKSPLKLLFGFIVITIVSTTVWLTGCKSCTEPEEDLYGFNEPTTSVRGVGKKEELFNVRGEDKESKGSYSSVLVQPLVLSGREIDHRPFVMGYYSNSLYEISHIAVTLKSVPETGPSTCKPHWRIDLTGPRGHTVVTLNEVCRRLSIEGKTYEYTPEIEKIIEHLLHRAVRRPTHRIVRLQVPVLYSPRHIKSLLANSAVTTYEPSKEHGRNPRVKVSAKRRAPIPADYTKLDEAAQALRNETKGFLKQYAQGLVDTKPEVVQYEGPYPIKEEFGRDLRVHYGATVFFRVGTDALTMRYHSSYLELQIDEVVVPEYYRIDAVYPQEKSYREIRATISKIADEAIEEIKEKLKKQGEGKKERIPRLSIWKRSGR